MLHCSILCVGKLKEKFYDDACCEYQKRLRRFVKLSIVEIADEKAPKSYSDAQVLQTKETEGLKLLARIAPEDHVIALCIDGKSHSSQSWAQHIDELMLRGQSKTTFVIGGSNGLSPAVIERANETVSFSAFTFCHQLMRVILLEQIYRSMKILAHEPYHK